MFRERWPLGSFSGRNLDMVLNWMVLNLLVRLCNAYTNLENVNFFVLTSPPLVYALQSLTSA